MLVNNIEHRRHLVAIFGRKSARRKSYGPYHIRVDDTQPLLLPRTDSQWPIDLYTVDIHDIFIEITPSHGILRTQLVTRIDTGKSCQHSLDTAPRRIGHQFQILRVDRLQRTRLPAMSRHDNLVQHLGVLIQTHRQGNIFREIEQLAALLPIPQTGINHHDGISCRNGKLILPFQIGHRPHRRSCHSYRSQLYGLIVTVIHASCQLHTPLCRQLKNRAYRDKKE